MNLERKFLTAFKDWLSDTAILVDYLMAYDKAPLRNNGKIKVAVKKTKSKRKYTKRSEFWKKPHPRKRP